MARYIKLEDLQKFPIRKDHYDKKNGNEHFIYGIETVFEYAECLPTYNVGKMQDCIYDLYVMLEKIIDNAKRCDLTALRPLRGAGGCDSYQGLPPICRSFDELWDKHEEILHAAANHIELKKKYIDDDTNVSAESEVNENG